MTRPGRRRPAEVRDIVYSEHETPPPRVRRWTEAPTDPVIPRQPYFEDLLGAAGSGRVRVHYLDHRTPPLIRPP
ncbi:hypothetical protein [Alsobacter sp. R-9]